MNAVIYARYSCDNQREESIEGQLRECKAFAEKNNYTLIDTYIDRAMSAKTDNRPEFQKMIKDSAKGQFNAIIVWKLDRFARNRYDSAHYKAALRKNGVRVISATEAISQGSEGIILESVLEGYAEYYSAELSEKVIRGMTENALKCQYNGGFVPVGFKIDENKHYQLDELVAPLVREAFMMYVNGKPIKDIVEFLNNHGVLSSQGKPLTKTSVSTILQNRKYIGEYQYRDVVVPNGIPAVISDELFSLAQQRLEKNRHAPATMKADIKYILSTKLRCGDCGGMMVGESGTSSTNNKVYHYYKCSNAKKRKCGRKALRKAEIEDIVVERTVKTVMNDVILDSVAERVFEFQQRENTVLPLLQNELADVEKAIGNFMKAIEMGVITESTMARLSELEQQKSDIKVKIAKEEIKSAVLSKEQIMFWLHKMKDSDILNDDNRERIVDTFINSIYVYDDKVVINYNCREDSDTILPDNMGESSYLSVVGEPPTYPTEPFLCGVFFYIELCLFKIHRLNRLICEETIDSDSNVVVKYVYTLGVSGERVKVEELDRTVEYTYDSLYRLTSETITKTTYTHAYDNVSNRTLKNVDGVDTVYTYNSLNQLVSENNTTYEYDNAGNLVRVVGAGKIALYKYDSENRLIKATVQQGNNVVVETYTYDYAGNRTSKTTTINNHVEKVYYLNDNSSLTNVLVEFGANGDEICYYTIGADLVSQEVNSKVYTYLYDGHGTVRALK